MSRYDNVTGYYRGYFYKRSRIKNIMPSYEGRGNPLLYFAYDITGDYIVTGVKTQREVREALDEFGIIKMSTLKGGS
jgi:hypothetical protein